VAIHIGSPRGGHSGSLGMISSYLLNTDSRLRGAM
jgi:hypothetical protein